MRVFDRRRGARGEGKGEVEGEPSLGLGLGHVRRRDPPHRPAAVPALQHQAGPAPAELHNHRFGPQGLHQLPRGRRRRLARVQRPQHPHLPGLLVRPGPPALDVHLRAAVEDQGAAVHERLQPRGEAPLRRRRPRRLHRRRRRGPSRRRALPQQLPAPRQPSFSIWDATIWRVFLVSCRSVEITRTCFAAFRSWDSCLWCGARCRPRSFFIESPRAPGPAPRAGLRPRPRPRAAHGPGSPGGGDSGGRGGAGSSPRPAPAPHPAASGPPPPGRPSRRHRPVVATATCGRRGARASSRTCTRAGRREPRPRIHRLGSGDETSECAILHASCVFLLLFPCVTSSVAAGATV